MDYHSGLSGGRCVPMNVWLLVHYGGYGWEMPEGVFRTKQAAEKARLAAPLDPDEYEIRWYTVEEE